MTDESTATAGKTNVEKRDDREIVAERIFNAPREEVFKAMTDPELIPQWWGPRDTTTVVDKMDPVEGGDYRFIVGNDQGARKNAFRGTFREIVEPERVVQTFEWEGMPGHVLVDSATLEDLGDGRTKVTIVSLFHTTEERDGMLNAGMEGGLNESHDRLAELLAK